MKVAVTYEDGKVFQHFGKTENFKVYDIEDGAVVSSEVIGNDGLGHEALATLLAEKNIDVLICGGMGSGAQSALAENGIEVFSGAEGDADSAVEKFLRGELESVGVNCDHHEHEHEHEEESCESGCGGGCGGCSGCGPKLPPIEGKNAGKNVKVHYKGTFDDGTQFDSSYDRGETLDFVCGAGMMIPGFDKAVANMEVGEEIDVHLMPEDAYGMPNPNMIHTIEIAQLPGSEGLTVGQKVQLETSAGYPIICVVAEKTPETITFDANHEMAGKELNFHIQLVEVQ